MSADLPQVEMKFFIDLMDGDELGAILRAHLHIEYSLSEFIRYRLQSPSQLSSQMFFVPRLELACALGLPEGYAPALKKFNKIRNTFGHNLDASLSEKDVNDLFNTLPSALQTLSQEALNVMQETATKGGFSPIFKENSVRNRFSLIVITLKILLVHSAHIAKGAGAMSDLGLSVENPLGHYPVR